MTQLLTLDAIDYKNKNLLVRVDFNVPMQNGVILNDRRIKATISGIKQMLNTAAKVILCSHLGRPDGVDDKYSLQPIAEYLEHLLGQPVNFIADWPVDISKLGSINLLENVRFLPGELDNNSQLAQQLASLCDIYVLDAFGSAHREHASTVGVIDYVECAVAGPLLEDEITNLDKAIQKADHPIVAVIGGAKVSGKLPVLHELYKKVDVLIIGGGMANTFLAAAGYNVGDSLYEPSMLSQAKELLDEVAVSNCKLVMPVDCILQTGQSKSLELIANDDKILDIGEQTIDLMTNEIKDAATIIWNGPLGMFENKQFARGTNSIARSIADSSAFSVIGGGETISVIDNLGLHDEYSYISTGGGAFLEYIEGKELPAIKSLEQKSKI